MIVITVITGFLIAAGLSLLATALISNAKDVRDNIGVPRIKFNEFKKLSKWVEFEVCSTYVNYLCCGLWNQFTFGYWGLLRYKVWKATKEAEESKAAADRRRKQDKIQLEELRKLAEEKKNSGRG